MDLTEFMGLQVISLTEELLETARQSENAGLDILASLDASPSFKHGRLDSQLDNVSIHKLSLQVLLILIAGLTFWSHAMKVFASARKIIDLMRSV